MPIGGIESKGYLCFYKDGKLVEKKHIRNDAYRPQHGVVVRGANKRPTEDPAPDMLIEQAI